MDFFAPLELETYDKLEVEETLALGGLQQRTGIGGSGGVDSFSLAERQADWDFSALLSMAALFDLCIHRVVLRIEVLGWYVILSSTIHILQ